MKPEDCAAYVDAAAALAGLDLSGPRREAVIAQFSGATTGATRFLSLNI